MVYKEVLLDLIDPNPFQKRKMHDSEVITSIAVTASDRIGIRNAPLIRPHPKEEGRYQIGSGHGRIEACRSLGDKTTICRVEDFSDAEMKKELALENFARQNYDEDETFETLEQCRLDPVTDDDEVRIMLIEKKHGFMMKLAESTGAEYQKVRDTYDVREIKDELTNIIDYISKLGLEEKIKEVSSRLILKTAGLVKKDRVKLVIKAVQRRWGANTTHDVKKSLKNMIEEVRGIILNDKTKLTADTIIHIEKLEDPEMQKKAIQVIQKRGYNEERALKYINKLVSGGEEEEKDRGADLTVKYPMEDFDCPQCGRHVTLRLFCDGKGKHRVEVN